MHEIITLQLGQRSNYLATHFWNAQESYFTYSADQEPLVNHDIHWRPGLGADGSETFMPRTVIYDLKGGFGSLRKINALYDVEDDGTSAGLWNGPQVIQRQEPIPPSAYQQSLETGSEAPELTTDAVRYWSDFNRVYFHPRSVVQLNEYELNSSLVPFERWATGEDLFRSLDREHDIVDRDLRPFIEESDQMQGIQIMASIDDAWGGFASNYVERLSDEYGKAAIWVWGLQDPFQGVPRDKRLLRLANKAKTLTEVYRHASLVVPLTLPSPLGSHVALDPSSIWHTSAVASAALETALLPSRLKNLANADTLGDMTALLNTTGKQSIASLQMSLGPRAAAVPRRRAADGNRDAGGEDEEKRDGVRLDLDFSPSDRIEHVRQANGFHKPPRVFSQLVTTRGDTTTDGDGEEDDADEVEPEDTRQRRRDANDPIKRRYETSLAFPLIDSFPKIFRDDGGHPFRHNVNVTTSLSTDAAVSDRLKLLRSTVTRSIGLEDREALSNDLAEMAEEYREGWSSDSDEGDDD